MISFYYICAHFISFCFSRSLIVLELGFFSCRIYTPMAYSMASGKLKIFENSFNPLRARYLRFERLTNKRGLTSA